MKRVGSGREGGLSLWIEASRPRTLVAGVVPVLVGTAASGRFSLPRFAGALVVAVGMQVGVNFANDLFDAQRGVDTEERIGPRRLTASGLISQADMGRAMITSFFVAIVAGLSLAAVAGWELAVVGAISLAAALGYSGGPWPYGSKGLGEVFVFIFFGLVATVGSAYVQSESITPLAVAASFPVGLLASAILVVNNLRDIETDGKSGKRTLAVRLGEEGTRLLFSALILGAYLLLVPVIYGGGGLKAAAAVASIPFAFPALRLVGSASGRALLPALGATAKLQLAFGVLLAVGLWL